MANIVGSAAIRIAPDLSGFRSKLDSDLKSATAGLKVDIKVAADTTEARTNLAAVQRQVSDLKSRRANIAVSADIASAMAKLSALSSEMRRIDGNRLTVQADADTARAQAQLTALNASVDHVDGRRISIDTGSGLSGIFSLSTAIAGLVPVITSVTAALAPLVGLLGALPGMAVGLGQVGGALGLAFNGIGAAIKEADSAQKDMAKNAISGGRTQIDMSSQIAAAHEGVAAAARNLKNVQRDNAEAVLQDNQRIKDAMADLRQAHKDMADAWKDDTKAITDAQRDLADAHADAARQQIDDLRDIADAQKDAEQAQLDLNEARQQAVKDLEDLNESLSDSNLDRRQAELDLQKQQEETNRILADGNSTQLERQQALLDLEKAQDRLNDAQKRESDLAKEKEEADKKGVENSDKVKKAKENLSDAEQRIADAREARARHEEESRRKFEDLERAIQEASEKRDRDREESEKRIDDLERAVDDARRSRHQNALDRADALRNAQVNLAQAQRSLADVQKKSATALDVAASSAANLTEAYDNLTPAGKAFVDQFVEVKKTLGDIGKAVQEATLPGFTSFLSDVNDILPSFKDVLVDTGDAVGDFAAAVGDLLKGEFGQQLHDVMETNVGVIKDMLGVDNGGGLLGLITAFGNVAEAAQPLTEWMGRVFNKFGKWAADTTTLANENGKLARFFETAKDTAKTLGSILGNVFEIIKNIFTAAFPSGTGLLKSIDDATEKFAKWSGTPDAQAKMKKFFEDVANIWRTIADTVARLVEKLGPLLAQAADFAAKHPKLVAGAVTVGAAAGVASKVPGAGIAGSLAQGALGAGLSGLISGGGGAAGITALTSALAPLSALLLPLLAFLAAWKLSPDFRDMVSGSFKKGIDGIKDAFAPLHDKFTEFWDKNGGWISRLGEIWAKGFGREIAGLIEAVGKAIEVVFDAMGVILDLLNGDWNSAWEGVKTMMGDLVGVFAGLWKAMFSGVITVWEEVLWPFLQNLGSTIWDGINSGWHFLVDGLNTAWTALWTGVKTAFDATIDWFQALPGKIWGWISGKWTDLTTAFLKAWDDLKLAIRTNIDLMVTFFENLPGKIWGWISGKWADLTTKFLEAWTTLKKDIRDNIDLLVTFFQGLPGKIWGWISGKWTDLTTDFLASWTALKTDIRDSLNGMQDFFEGLPEKFLGWINKNWESKIKTPLMTLFSELVTAISGVWDDLKAKFAAPINWIVDYVINPMIDKINWVINKLGGGANTIAHVGNVDSGTGATTGTDHAAQQHALGGIINFASGGVMPGYTPGKDVHRFYSPTGGRLELSGGEAVMRPEWTKAVGGPDAVDKMNRNAILGARTPKQLMYGMANGGVMPDLSFWLGGVFPVTGGAVTNTHDGYGHYAVDINRGSGYDDYGDPVHAWKGGRVASHNYIGDASYGRWVVLDHGGQSSLYAHLSAFQGPGSGASVSAGQVIGNVGDLGNTGTPPTSHLHFEIMGGSPDYGDTGGEGGGGGGISFPNPLDLLSDAFKGVKDNISNAPGGSIGKELAKAIFGKIKDEAFGWVKNKASDFWGLVSGPAKAFWSGATSLVDAAKPWDGWLPGFAGGGLVPGVGQGDSMRAMLTPGEYVMRKPVVDRLGAATFDRINSAAVNQVGSLDDASQIDRLIAVLQARPTAPYVGTLIAQENVDIDRVFQQAAWNDQRMRV